MPSPRPMARAIKRRVLIGRSSGSPALPSDGSVRRRREEGADLMRSRQQVQRGVDLRQSRFDQRSLAVAVLRLKSRTPPLLLPAGE